MRIIIILVLIGLCWASRAAGNYTFTFNVAMVDANYASACCIAYSTTYTGWSPVEDSRLGSRSTSVIYIASVTPNGSGYADGIGISLSIFGN